MEARTLRERKGVSYDEKALEAQQYKGDFEFMDTDTETKQRRKGRQKALGDEDEKDVSDVDSDFVDQEPSQQSLDEASEGDRSDDSDFAAAKKPKQPARRLAARGGAARTGIYKEPSSGDEADAESSSGGESEEEERAQPGLRTTRAKAAKAPAAPARRSERANRPVDLAELSVNSEEHDAIEDSEASLGGSGADEKASDDQDSGEKRSADNSDVDMDADDPPTRANGKAPRQTRAGTQRKARSLENFAMVKDGAKAPVKAAQPSKKEAAKESRGSKQAKGKKEKVDLDLIERILDVSDEKGQVCVKFRGMSYRKAEWVPEAEVMEAKPQLLRNFMQRRYAGGDEEEEEQGVTGGIHHDWLEIDRIIAKDKAGRYLVKWRGLGYSEATWESSLMPSDKADIQAFRSRERPPKKAAPVDCSQHHADSVPDFLNGRVLRDYQTVSLHWMMENFRKKRSCILGDEMGLGKTAQSIATLAFQKQFLGVTGPHIVIAPLTTLGHWRREIQTWTDMNVLEYTGSKADRQVIRKHEFHYADARTKALKFDVLLTSYETVLRDSSTFLGIKWETMIADEAHRFKSVSGQTRNIITRMSVRWKLLLTGTPVQNSMEELYGIMNVLDPAKWDDEDNFLERFGKGMPTPEQVHNLQDELRPILLRRMKEDVEDLPQKEEIVVRVQLTRDQRGFYKAIFAKQIGALLGGVSSKNIPQMQNLAMELRKVCCHPFLCRGLEDHVTFQQAMQGQQQEELQQLVQASGKMVLLNKLLPKLRAEGHKVLIFSQFKIMLNVLEDYLRLMKFPLERIDGSVSQRDRELAINRFSAEGSDGFVFLLSTRAGGQGITLTAADTVIIYDTDFNPQNDLQAMARCHRIGQDKDVTVYRLITDNTYEQNVFECSTRKQGLDNAILGYLNADERKVDPKRIAQLLAHGAHAMQAPDEEAAQEGQAFAEEDIDDILRNRTEKRQLGNSKGNTFSTATFTIEEEPQIANAADARSYWGAIMPDVVANHDAEVAAAAQPKDLGKRQRKKVSYNEAAQARDRTISTSDSEYKGSDGIEEDDDEDDEDGASASGVEAEGAEGKKKSKKLGEAGEAPPKPLPQWKVSEVRALEEALLQHGEDRTATVRAAAGLEHYEIVQVAAVEDALVTLMRRCAALPEKPLPSDAPEGAKSGAPRQPSERIIPKDMKLPRFARKGLESVAEHLWRHRDKYAAQLADRLTLRKIIDTDDDALELVVAIRYNASSTSGLPAWWGFNEDHMLLIEADERGYYPSSRSRNPSEGFISSFLQSRCKSRCRFDPGMVEAKPVAEKDSEDQDIPSAEPMPLEPADSALQVPKPPAAGEGVEVMGPRNWKRLVDAASRRYKALMVVLRDPAAAKQKAEAAEAARRERKRRRAEERLALKTAKEAEERRQRQIAALGANLGLTDDFALPARPGESGGPCSDGARVGKHASVGPGEAAKHAEAPKQASKQGIARKDSPRSSKSGSKQGKENAPRNVPAALAGENSKSLVRPSSAKRKLEKLGALKQSTLQFAKRPSTGLATKAGIQTAVKPEPAVDDDDEPIVID